MSSKRLDSENQMQEPTPPKSRSRGPNTSRTKRKRKEFGARCVETKQPRSKWSLFWVIVLYLLVMFLILLCCSGTFTEHLPEFGVGLLTAMFFLICAKELYIYGRQLMTGLSFNRTNKDDILCIGLIPGVIVVFLGNDLPATPQILKCLLIAFLVLSKVFFILLLKITRNEVDSSRILERMPAVVGPGLAQAFSGYLENVIVGKCGSPRYNEAINNYRKQEGIPDDKDWILNKVMIFFPEAKESRGSVEELVKKHNQGRVNHKLCFEKIKHNYEINGQTRVSWMEVLKLYDEDRCGYVVIVENRPLNTLYTMAEQKVFSEDKLKNEEMFKIQFHAYKNELKRLLDQKKGCMGNYEFFHYKDSKLRDFGSAVIAKIDKMKLDELK